MRLFSTILVILIFQHNNYGQVSITKEPTWIIKEHFDSDVAPPQNGADGGVHVLLYTEQVHVELEERYTKGVSKVVEYSGIQNISNVVADYDPSYQQLQFHSIKVIRNDVEINKLTYPEIQTARRETNAENFIYDGTISAFVNIPDVRMGDIVSYSYTIKGFNPIQKKKFSTSFVLNSSQAINRLSIHVLANRKINYQVLNSDLEVNYRQNQGLHHYEWRHENVPAVLFEDLTPSWHIQNAMIIMSEYDSWTEVKSWGQELFEVSEPLNKELQEVVHEIRNSYTTEGARIKAALSFVQNEVRYLGLHSGIGGYQPNQPNEIIKQRFGDCKDKSILLTTILKALEIEAYPALVNTSLRQILPSLTPSSKLFDHCIVKVIDERGTELWYDPTLGDQGGGYSNIYMPDYRFGLVLGQEMTEMDTISNFGANLVEVYRKFKLDEFGKGSELEVRTHYFEGEADFMRSIFRNTNNELIEKELLKFYTETFGATSAAAPPTFVDDSLRNEFALLERYRIDSIWRPSMENKNQLNLTIFPTNLTNVLTMPNQLERSAPFALSFPMVRKEHVEIVLPEGIQVRPESKTINSDFFYYDFNSDYDSSTNTLTLDYYYKNQDDHVPVDEFDAYYQDMVQLDQNMGYLIYINKNNIATAGSIGFGLASFMGYGIIALILLSLIIVILVLVVRKTNTRAVG